MTTTFPYQLGDSVEHRGIVIAPLFPRQRSGLRTT